MTTNDPNQSNPTGHQDHDLHDDHGLPSVNRRAGSNKLITILGTIFLLLAGIRVVPDVKFMNLGYF